MRMFIKHLSPVGLVFILIGFSSIQLFSASQESTNSLVIKSVFVNGQSLQLSPQAGRLNLGTFPKDVSFVFGSDNPSFPCPLRIRGKLEGFENNWHEGEGYMLLAVRFFNAAGDQIDQKNFQVSGESAGWNGSLKSSPLTHRRETLVVPPRAAQAWIVISSAGPPSTVGIYVVANLTMTKTLNGSLPTVLVESPFEHPVDGDNGETLRNWVRDGTHRGMAKIVEIGQEPAVKAFAIEDNDPDAHAEWHSIKETAPQVHPGDRLVIEWNEMYSIGVGDLRSILYPNLPAGSYKFRAIGIDLMGKSDGTETSLNIFVPQPFWKRTSFWSIILFLIMVIIFAGVRYAVWRKMEKEMLRLKSQQALESERLRIARDIHDDLGARVTQISMISATSLLDPALSEKTREEMKQIKQASRDLISVLYETVWTVNPAYDDLDALGNYLCQMVNQFCKQTSFHCRLQVAELPKGVQVSSQIRHNIAMVVKEAVNNAIKHSEGSEIILRLVFEAQMLKITVQDNGRGFSSIDSYSGNGLINMRQRMQEIGGVCLIESSLGNGTMVQLELQIRRK